MRRGWAVLGAVLIGLVVGAGTGIILQPSPPPGDDLLAPVSTITSSGSTPGTSSSATTEGPGPQEQVLLIWTPGGLPPDLRTAVAAIAGVTLVTEIRSDLVWLDGGDGLFIPLEAIAVDDAYPLAVPTEWRSVFDGIEDGEVVLGETSAALRGATIGDGVSLAGESVAGESLAAGSLGVVESTVVGIAPDVVVGAAEIVTTIANGVPMGITTPRYLLTSYIGLRETFERLVREALPEGLAVRIRAPGETPFLRSGDAVLPQAVLKSQFGEFAIRSPGSEQLLIADDWVGENIATVQLPLIGSATCHVGILTPLRNALAELEQSNLGFLIESFDGCYVPRFIGASRSISRHTWGIAIDFNYAANPTGQVTVQDPRLVSIMEKWGFTWGGNWLVPDAAHFEWVGSPLR